jgi:hypothetical protein
MDFADFLDAYTEKKVWTTDFPKELRELSKPPDILRRYIYDGMLIKEHSRLVEGTVMGFCTIDTVLMGREDIDIRWDNTTANTLLRARGTVSTHLCKKFHLENTWATFYPSVTVERPFFTVPVKKKDTEYPHKCPSCGHKALVLFQTVECTGIGCRNFRLGRGI